MLFLVIGKVRESHYMERERDPIKTMRIVEAEDESLAVDKFIKHFEDQTREYDVYYSVNEVEAFPAIS